MKAVGIFLIALVTYNVESGKRAKYTSMAKNEHLPQIDDESGEVVWPQPEIIRRFEVSGDFHGSSGFPVIKNKILSKGNRNNHNSN